jgi:hypothetical protein
MIEKELEDIRTDSVNETLEVLSLLESSVLYEGVVDIIMMPPLDIVNFIRLWRNLENTRGIRILSSNSSYGQESVIKVYLGKPMPLVEALMGMPGVKKAEVFTGAEVASTRLPWGYTLQEGKEEQPEQQIIIFFNPSPPGGDY